MKTTKELREEVKVGQIFATSWGYDMTIVEFFQVVEKPSPATVVIRQVNENVVEGCAGYSGQVEPIIDSFIGEPKRCRINKSGGISKADEYDNHATFLPKGESKYFNRMD